MRVGKQTVRAELAVNPGAVNLWGGGEREPSREALSGASEATIPARGMPAHAKSAMSLIWRQFRVTKGVSSLEVPR